jgi:hypothetical protein
VVQGFGRQPGRRRSRPCLAPTPESEKVRRFAGKAAPGRPLQENFQGPGADPLMPDDRYLHRTLRFDQEPG